VSSTDGVGTKLNIAAALGKHNTIGIDLVNHCVNDIFTCGASPLFFLDYISTGVIIPEYVEDIVKGIAQACQQVSCALIGGETAEMPGMYTSSDYDLAGFIVGSVEKDNIIDGTKIESGDVILGLPSSGLHTNGYSLVRKVFGTDISGLTTYYSELGRTLGEELLEPHRCYYSQLKPQLSLIKGMAHITGGGLVDNALRVVPDGLKVYIDKGSWPILPIFDLIQKHGNISAKEMYRVFNMGIGMVIFCSPSDALSLTSELDDARVIGRVESI